jgi:hypothetical protein
MRKLFALIGVVLALAWGTAWAVTYGTFANPFSATSIWNTKIADGASFVATGFESGTDSDTGVNHHRYWKDGKILIYQEQAGDTSRTVWKKAKDGYCSTTAADYASSGFSWGYSLKLPNTFFSERKVDNGHAAIVLTDGSIKEGYMWERCITDGASYPPYPDFAQRFSGAYQMEPHTISGEGFTGTAGSQTNAAKFTVLGGVVRSGELTDDTTTHIPHALKVHLSTGDLYYNASESDGKKGYRWPALAADAIAASAYKGTVEAVQLGTLLAIPTSFDCTSMLTVVGKKLCWAFQEYGGYVTDSCCSSPAQDWGIHFEIEHTGKKDGSVLPSYTVRSEVRTTYNIDLGEVYDCDDAARCGGGFKNPANYSTQATRDFMSDMDTLYTNFQVVDNVDPSYPKGPARPTVASAEIGSVDASTLVVNITNDDGPSGMNPASSCTGFSVKKNGSAATVSSCARSGAGSNQFKLTLASAGIGSDTFLVSYSETGNVVSTALGSPELKAFMDQAVTNNITGGSPSYQMRSRHFQWLRPNGSNITEAIAAEDTNTTIPVEGAMFLKGSIDCIDAACDAQSVGLWCRKNTDAYFLAPDTCTSGNPVCMTDLPGATHGLTAVNESLTNDAGGSYVQGKVIESQAEIPTFTLAQNDKVELVWAIRIHSSLVAGDTIECRPELAGGVDLDNYANTAKLTVRSGAGGSGGGSHQ